MKLLVCLAASVATLPTVFAVAQTVKSAPADLPPFAGHWVLNVKRSQLMNRLSGLNTAVILYDGNTWRYIHRHQDSPDDEPEAWQTTLLVNSPQLHTEVSSGDITFRSRIQRQSNTMLMTETGTTLHHQQVHNTIRYKLEDNNNTLIETETSVGPLRPQKNIYVLEREGTGATAPAN